VSQAPLNLTARDFDAYSAEKATSNAYSRPRLEVKQRALGWARGVVARLAAVGIAVDVHGSDEHPCLRNKKRVDCQWVFFWRDRAARDELERLLDQGRTISEEIDDPSPFRRHAFLALRVDTQAVEVCFAVHSEARVDIDNLNARLSSAEALDALMKALEALPEQFSIGVNERDRIPCGSATPEAIRGMLEAAAAGQVPLWIGWSVSRVTAIEHSEIMGEQLEDALVALAPIYRLVAWSKGNDHIALERRLEGMEQERARAHAQVMAENEKWLAERALERERSIEQARARKDEGRGALEGRKPTLASLFGEPAGRPKTDPPRHRSGSGSGDGGRSRGGSGARAGREALDRAGDSFGQAKEAREATRASSARAVVQGVAAIDKGARVRVRSGAFVDKIGVVSELDGRGGARVMLGLLSSRFELGELEAVADTRERPSLQSSHRRPAAPVPRKAR
jgi:hypothetical protein